MQELDLPLGLSIGILVLLLIASAFFSGSETALTRARRVRLRLLSEEGNLGARRAGRLLRHPEQMLAAILLGNNFANIAASSLASALFIAYFGEAGILYATVIMTIVVLIFSEVLPKTLAVVHAEEIACRAALPLLWIRRLLWPIIVVLMGVIDLIRGAAKVPRGREPELTHQELAKIIDIGAESGVLDKAREQMLSSSLRLHEVPVKAIMTPRKDMVMLNAGKTVEGCLKTAMRRPHSRYPVYHGEPDRLIGIIHLRDLLKLRNRHQRLADAIIWRNPPFIPASRNALEQLFDFQAKRQHMAIIVDEFGDIDGLITLEDIIEEIVGEIVDESDLPPPSEIWPQPDGSLVVAGTAGVHDINMALDIDLPEEGATTIGGLIVEILGHQPQGRLCLQLDNIQLEVLRFRENWIRRVRVSKVAPVESGFE